jgi:hypothetical protein
VSPVSSKRLAQSLHLSGECRISSRKLTPEEFLKGVWGETLEQERPESLDGFMAFITTFTDMNAKKRGALKEAAVVDEMYDLLATYEVTPTSHAETLALGFGFQQRRRSAATPPHRPREDGLVHPPCRLQDPILLPWVCAFKVAVFPNQP